MTRFFAVILILMSLPAQAAPPDAISIRDRIFGISATHVFILRDVNDNLGLHIIGMNDTYLVAKNIQTGQDETIWPVMRWHRGYDAAGEKSVLQFFPLNDAVNPFEILSQANALPISRAMSHPDDRFAPETWLKPDMLEIESQSLPLDAVFAQMRSSVELTSANVQPYPDSGFQAMTFSTPQELMAIVDLDFEWCKIDAAISVQATYEQPETHLVRIKCDGDSVQSANLMVLIPTEKAEN